MVPLLVAGGAYLLGKGVEAGFNAYGANKASRQQVQAGKDAQNQIRGYYTDAQGYQQPIYEQGMRNMGRLSDMVQGGEFDMQQQGFRGPQEGQYGQFRGPQEGQYGQFQQQARPGYGQYNTPQFDMQKDPGYQFRMQEGLNAVEGSAAARGTQLSGATMKALAKYGQNFASNEMANAYGRFQDQRNFGRGNFESDRAVTRGDYESDRGFGYGQFADQRGFDYNRFNTNRNFGYNQFSDNRDFNRNQFVDNRNFGYNEFTNAYSRGAAEQGNRYNRMSGLANYGIGAANNLSSLATGTGAQIAGLTTQMGNARAAGTMGQYGAAGQFFGDAGQAAGAYGLNYIMPTQYPMQNNINSGTTAAGGSR
jgi:hypothetical protein